MRLDRLLQRMVHNWPVKAMSLAAAALLFLFHRISTLEERYFSVPIEILVDDALAPATPFPRTARITVRGERGSVFRIIEDDIEVYADFSIHTAEGIFKEPVQYYKKGSALEADFFELTIDPLELTLNLERKLSKTVPVKERLTGYPEKGYELGQYFIEPKEIVIEGPRSHMDGITEVWTEEIDINGAAGNIDMLVSLDLDNSYISSTEHQMVRFSGFVQETRITRTYDPVPIVLFDVPENVSIRSTLPSGEIKAQGPLLRIDELTSNDVILTADCSGITDSGTYSIPVLANVPDGIIVLSYNPTSIEIQVQTEGAE
ncbi:MAG: hypothetical protein JXB03_08555 [Spirochaetales bacterium]|nr:hypothetical protein [Spirochaetales bacterium]